MFVPAALSRCRAGLRRWLRARRGVIALEFALVTPVLLILMGVGVDFGMLLRVRVALAAGMMDAVQYAGVKGAATTTADLAVLLQNATALNGISTSINGPGLYCPSSGYPVTLTPLVGATTCPGATTPANSYVVITASYPYVPMMPGFSDLVATTVQQSATVMVQ